MFVISCICNTLEILIADIIFSCKKNENFWNFFILKA